MAPIKPQLNLKKPPSTSPSSRSSPRLVQKPLIPPVYDSPGSRSSTISTASNMASSADSDVKSDPLLNVDVNVKTIKKKSKDLCPCGTSKITSWKIDCSNCSQIWHTECANLAGESITADFVNALIAWQCPWCYVCTFQRPKNHKVSKAEQALLSAIVCTEISQNISDTLKTHIDTKLSEFIPHVVENDNKDIAAQLSQLRDDQKQSTESLQKELTALKNTLKGSRQDLPHSPNMNSNTMSNIKTPTQPVVHNYRHIEKTTDNFISDESSQTLIDFFSTEEFRAENGHGVALYGDSYKYMGSKATPKPVPDCLHDIMATLNSQISGKYELNSCLVNKYDGAESFLPEHSDNEYSVNPDSEIFTVSIGLPRVVTFRDTFTGTEVKHVANPGSLYTMTRESQSFYSHRVDADDTSPGIRYSITFRCVHWSFLNSTCVIGDSNTRLLKFGTGKGTFGQSTPGTKIWAATVDEINPQSCSAYSNVVLIVGTNDLRQRCVVSRDDVKNIYASYKAKVVDIMKINKRCKIFIVPVLPTKLMDVNRKIMHFNSLIYDDLVPECLSVVIVSGSRRFLDSQDNLLSERLSTPGDVLHLNFAGVALLATQIKTIIFQRKRRGGMVHSNRSYANVLTGGPRGPRL